MIEIYQNLFVGSQDDEAEIRTQNGWFVIHACKEPYHRQALGYTSRGAPKGHPEYLIAYRPGRLILNLVDVADVNFVPAQIMDIAINEIANNIKKNKVLVHCNQGLSRSPTIALLYLAKHTDVFKGKNLNEVLRDFIKKYPDYAPAQGMADYVKNNWAEYSSSI
ncbi:MAG TPA: dual specificity protein phosphatase [Candidatus Angelobacter sp.]|nr:dual specificity protein phosphatase [Candidatus Angelobacter sp.]